LPSPESFLSSQTPFSETKLPSEPDNKNTVARVKREDDGAWGGDEEMMGA
jgi:hypothetical protein